MFHKGYPELAQINVSRATSSIFAQTQLLMLSNAVVNDKN